MEPVLLAVFIAFLSGFVIAGVGYGHGSGRRGKKADETWQDLQARWWKEKKIELGDKEAQRRFKKNESDRNSKQNKRAKDSAFVEVCCMHAGMCRKNHST